MSVPLIRRIQRLRPAWVLFCAWMASFCGCGEFFNEKPAELQTEVILRELRQVKQNPHTNNPLPELYKGKPQRVRVADGIKLFYFTKQHTPERLAQLVEAQLGYKVSVSNATNQIIVHCPGDDDIDQTLAFLEKVDVPPIQVNVDCLILERFADVTMDWETTIKIDNFLGESITFGGKTDPDTGELLPNFPGASLREPRRSNFGLDIGYGKNIGVAGHEFRALVDLLVSKGYLKILMNPTIETINGSKALIVSKEYAPIEKIVTPQGVDPYALTEYKWVEDTLEVTPSVYSDGSIGLSAIIKLGSRSKPEGVVQTSIITERSIQVDENRIKPGESLVVGGIRKSTERAVIRGVPFFKDIPLFGILFSSKDYEERATEVIFILTPSISSGGVMHADVIEDIKDKMRPPAYKYGLREVFTDPLGSNKYIDEVEQAAAAAEFDRIKAEIEKAEAIEEVGIAKRKLLRVTDELSARKKEMSDTRRSTKTDREEALEPLAEAEKALSEAQVDSDNDSPEDGE